MISMQSVKMLTSMLGEERVLIDELMKNHTSFKIGGPADAMAFPKNSSELVEIIKFCVSNKIPYMIMGNGTNLLVSDNGIRGLIVKINDNMNSYNVNGDILELEAGMLISKASKLALEHSLSGLEFAEGIPGTVGGAVIMNAGAYNGEMSQVVSETDYLDGEGNIITINNAQHEYGYRTSIIQKRNGTVLKTRLLLQKGDYSKIKSQMDEFNFKRRDKQPLEWPSAGSVFKRPTGFFVGKLIDDCGLRGFNIGGAQISDKHSGFIINRGNATCKDVLSLIEYIQITVERNFGVKLEPEIRIVGEFQV